MTIVIIGQGYYTLCHHQVANTVHQKLAIKGSTKPYYKYEPPSVLENFSYKLYYDRTIIMDQTTHNSRQDTVTLDKSTIEAKLIDIAIPNSHNLHNTITENIRKYTELKEEL
jgi:hypothetical protein